jgi:ubiquinone/menaquinone biosynthesis C-methylase UbiE
MTAHHPGTAEAERWNGPDGQHWAANAARYDAMAAGYTAQLMAAADIRPADRVLDIGCGTGETTRLAAVHANAGHATGIDLSAPMLAVAAELAAAEGITNLSWIRGDAQHHPFPEAGFDVAISRSGVMFFPDPVAAFSTVARALRPGGRLAFVCHAATANPLLSVLADIAPRATVQDAEPGVARFADPQWVRELLERTGFHDVRSEAFESRTTAGADADDATEFLLAGSLRSLVRDLTPAARERTHHALTSLLRPLQTPDGVVMPASGLCYTARTR